MNHWLRVMFGGLVGNTMRRMANAAGWLLADHVLRLAGGFWVGLWVARHLGPAEFGLLNQALALVALMTGITTLGLHNHTVSALVRLPAERGVILSAVLLLRFIAAVLAFSLIAVLAYTVPTADPRLRILIVIVALPLTLNIAEVWDWALQADGRLRESAWVRSSGFLLATSAKVVLIIIDADLTAFAIVIAAEAGLYAIGWSVVIWRCRGATGLRWPTWAKFITTGRAGWILALTMAAVQLQGYLDQVLIGAWCGPKALGEYAAAFRIVMVAAFVPAVMQVVVGPDLAAAQQKSLMALHLRLRGFYQLALFLSVLLIVPLAGGASWIVDRLYGAQFSEASVLLPWMTGRLIFAHFGTLRSLYLINTGNLVWGLWTAAAGAVTNVALNIWLIPSYGPIGAISASLVSFTVTVFIIDWLRPSMRTHSRLLWVAILLPWRKPSN